MTSLEPIPPASESRVHTAVPGKPRRSLRPYWVLVHRYAGLYIAFFLTIAGLTGSVLAFYHEIDHWLNPELSYVPVQDRPMLDGFALREKALAEAPHATINMVQLHREPGEVFTAWLSAETDPATQKPYELEYDNLRLNPYTGEVLDRSKSDDYWPLNRRNILSFLYALHYSLALGNVGVWLFGIAAFIWTLDCFVAFYLTFPAQVFGKAASADGDVGMESRRGFWSRWAVAWKVKWRSSFHRVNFDLHRAGGLWTWLMILVFAWSSVAFNLSEPVYQPVMATLFDMPDLMAQPRPNLAEARPHPNLGWADALKIGRKLMADHAEVLGITVGEEQALYHDAEKGIYGYLVRSDRDIGDHGGGTTIYFDSNDGTYLGTMLPTGQNAGLTITLWLVTLHMAGIWGLPYKSFVCLMGMVIAMLSITGVYLWWKKRQARHRHRLSRPAPQASLTSTPEA